MYRAYFLLCIARLRSISDVIVFFFFILVAISCWEVLLQIFNFRIKLLVGSERKSVELTLVNKRHSQDNLKPMVVLILEHSCFYFILFKWFLQRVSEINMYVIVLIFYILVVVLFVISDSDILCKNNSLKIEKYWL